jgi:hypothetical protein
MRAYVSRDEASITAHLANLAPELYNLIDGFRLHPVPAQG